MDRYTRGFVGHDYGLEFRTHKIYKAAEDMLPAHANWTVKNSLAAGIAYLGGDETSFNYFTSITGHNSILTKWFIENNNQFSTYHKQQSNCEIRGFTGAETSLEVLVDHGKGGEIQILSLQLKKEG